MINPLANQNANALLISIKPFMNEVLRAINECRFDDTKSKYLELEQAFSLAKSKFHEETESFLNAIFAIKVFVKTLKNYGETWELVFNKEFSASWSSLQDTLNNLRMVKKFSCIDVSQFESQLLVLETLYPYKVFFSVGMEVDYFECSICGNDIDSDECEHLMGELYNGVFASATAKNVARLDHVSMVENPADKKCVISISDESEQFECVRFLSEKLRSKEILSCQLSDTKEVHYKRANPEYVRLNRNAMCFCGSGKKFKKCCIDKQYVDAVHVNLVFEQNAIQNFLVD